MSKTRSDFTPRASPEGYSLAHRLDDSTESLCNLERLDGPVARPRALSLSGFDFQQELLPLSASLSEPDVLHADAGEKNIGVIQSRSVLFPRLLLV